MARRPGLPHDRAATLWSAGEGASHMLQASFDRWGMALIEDDGITSPLMGSDHPVTAKDPRSGIGYGRWRIHGRSHDHDLGSIDTNPMESR